MDEKPFHSDRCSRVRAAAATPPERLRESCRSKNQRRIVISSDARAQSKKTPAEREPYLQEVFQNARRSPSARAPTDRRSALSVGLNRLSWLSVPVPTANRFPFVFAPSKMERLPCLAGVFSHAAPEAVSKKQRTVFAPVVTPTLTAPQSRNPQRNVVAPADSLNRRGQI